MITYVNKESLQRQHEDIVPKLFDYIERAGGYVERSLYLSPAEAFEIDKVQSPWVSRFFGSEFDSWEEVSEAAIVLSESDDKRKVSDSLRQLANNFTRQRTPVWNVARHSLSQRLTMIGRFRHALSMTLKYDQPIYNQEKTDPLGLKHYLSYIYKFSPLSQYCPDLWLAGLRGYGETRPLDLNDDDIKILAEAIVEIQRSFGVLDHIHELEPNTLEATQVRALSTNPASAYSLPTMANAKSKDERARSLELAKEYKADPSKHGNIPYVGQRRIQQGGNVLDVYLTRLFPSFDVDTQYPTIEQFDACIEVIARERPWMHYYSKEQMVQDKFVRQVRLPDAMEQREALVDSGEEEPCILLKFADGSYRFNYKVSEPTPWKLISDDAEAAAKVDLKYHDMMKSKNRNVFAGSNPVALNKQAYVHKCVDMFKQWTDSPELAHMTASWKEPSQLRRVLTNMFAVANGVEDSDRMTPVVSPEESDFCGSLSGDDKSSFDNFQFFTGWAAFNCCILGPVFKPEYYKVLKQTTIQTLLPKVMTYDGMMCFSESMPSGEGSTNFQDGFLSLWAGTYDICRRSGRRPKQIYDSWHKHKTGSVFQGDDYEGLDQHGADLQAKQDSFTKMGLVVSVSKSLVSKYSFEYVRMFSDGNWRVDVKGMPYTLCMHAPLMHMLVKVNFDEDSSSISPAIDDVSNINRSTNVQWHPKFIEIQQELADYSYLHMGTVRTEYVPQFLIKDWRKAGEPSFAKAPQFYRVIDCPSALVKVAAEEAEFKGTNLDAATNIGWQAQYDDTTKFNDLRSVQVLNAMTVKDTTKLALLDSQVVNVQNYLP